MSAGSTGGAPALPSRRDFLRSSIQAGLAASLAGCASAAPFSLRPDEQRLLSATGSDFQLVVRGRPNSLVLRRRARAVPPDLDLSRVASRMERTMLRARGVGIAGPQVGLSLRVVSLKLDYRTDKPRLIFARNPVIVARSDRAVSGYEGCLSIPGFGGLVRRNDWIKVRYLAEDSSLKLVEARGPNAVLWQHEIDHLDGTLYVDRLIGELLPRDEMLRRRRKSARALPIPFC